MQSFAGAVISGTRIWGPWEDCKFDIFRQAKRPGWQLLVSVAKAGPAYHRHEQHQVQSCEELLAWPCLHKVRSVRREIPVLPP